MNETRVKPNPATWELLAAFACFAGSILSLALGFAFTTDSLLNAVGHPFLHAVGITLLIIGIPILILGGHCLDLMDKKNKKSDRVLPVGQGALRE
jgi:predicted Na+-dependent transporter